MDDDSPSSTGCRRVPLDILVVDDDAASLELAAEIVEHLGHDCRTATDGEEALRMLAEQPADVVVSDWDMPGMNGEELCRSTRSAGDDAPYTYFVMVTAFTDRAHTIGAMAAGADGYHVKPIDVDKLEACLLSAERVVQHHRRLARQKAELRADGARHYVASRTDALTGVGNRLHLEEEIAVLLSRARRYGHNCALALVDLDFFKAYNDHFGHVAGDAALCSVAGEMRATLRSDDSVYRYGGEEFVVLLVEQSLGDAARAMQRMRAAVNHLGIPSPATGGALTVSIGIADVDPLGDRSPLDWLRRADAALYEAKRSGRNRLVSSRPPPR